MRENLLTAEEETWNDTILPMHYENVIERTCAQREKKTRKNKETCTYNQTEAVEIYGINNYERRPR